jgi:hypothetical protein
MVNTNKPITSSFSKKVDAKDTTRSWDCIIYISDRDRGSLPTNINDGEIQRAPFWIGHYPNPAIGGVKQLCIVKSDLTGIQDSEMTMKRKSRRFLLKGKKYYLCTFDVKSIIGPADLRFELWFGGQKFSRNHDPLKVTWDSEGTEVGS